MPTDYVLDASAVARLFLDQQGASEFEDWYHVRRRERCRFHAPDLLPYELANILHRDKGKSSEANRPDYLISIVRDATQGIMLDPDAWARTWAWAGRLSAYDAAYAALAQVKQATLVTYDKRLTRTAGDEIDVIGLGGLD